MADAVVLIDQVEGQKRVMNNIKLYVKLLNKFLAEDYLGPLKTALDGGDMPAAQAAAHTIKGLAANLSLIALNKAALEIETQIKAGAAEPGEYDKVAACYEATQEEIKKVVAQYA
jgi:HPt (histidine-containing phosphotransfer) domain-containing protein